MSQPQAGQVALPRLFAILLAGWNALCIFRSKTLTRENSTRRAQPSNLDPTRPQECGWKPAHCRTFPKDFVRAVDFLKDFLVGRRTTPELIPKSRPCVVGLNGANTKRLGPCRQNVSQEERRWIESSLNPIPGHQTKKKDRVEKSRRKDQVVKLCRGLCEFLCGRIPIWLWLKKMVPKWNPGKWKHGPKPAQALQFHCEPYPYPPQRRLSHTGAQVSFPGSHVWMPGHRTSASVSSWFGVWFRRFKVLTRVSKQTATNRLTLRFRNIGARQTWQRCPFAF